MFCAHILSMLLTLFVRHKLHQKRQRWFTSLYGVTSTRTKCTSTPQPEPQISTYLYLTNPGSWADGSFSVKSHLLAFLFSPAVVVFCHSDAVTGLQLQTIRILLQPALLQGLYINKLIETVNVITITKYLLL